MPKGKTGKLVTKSEVRRTVPKLKSAKAIPAKTQLKTAKKQSIAKISRTAKPVSKKIDTAQPHHPSISITLHIPQLRRPRKVTTPSTTVKKSRKLLSALLVPIALVIAGLVVFLPDTKHSPKTVAVAEAASRATPSYQPLMLADQSPSSQSYDGKRNMVGFTTSFSGSRVTVSEQALPESFTRDPAALLRAADSINAKQRIDTDHGPVFIASNEVAGDQMAVFADKQVLAFIHTDRKMDDTSWKSFAEQLKPADWQSSESATQ